MLCAQLPAACLRYVAPRTAGAPRWRAGRARRASGSAPPKRAACVGGSSVVAARAAGLWPVLRGAGRDRGQSRTRASGLAERHPAALVAGRRSGAVWSTGWLLSFCCRALGAAASAAPRRLVRCCSLAQGVADCQSQPLRHAASSPAALASLRNHTRFFLAWQAPIHMPWAAPGVGGPCVLQRTLWAAQRFNLRLRAQAPGCHTRPVSLFSPFCSSPMLAPRAVPAPQLPLQHSSFSPARAPLTPPHTCYSVFSLGVGGWCA